MTTRLRRFTLFAIIGLLFLFLSQGPLTPSTTVDDNSNGGAITWVNPNNSQTENGVSATAAYTDNTSTTDWLKCTNFGFSVPGGSTINGILVEWKDFDATQQAEENDQQIVKGGVIGGEPATGVNLNPLPATLTFTSSGGSTDLWNNSWTTSDINASTFGVAIAVDDFTAAAPGTIGVDVVRITVTYTASSGQKKKLIGYNKSMKFATHVSIVREESILW